MYRCTCKNKYVLDSTVKCSELRTRLLYVRGQGKLENSVCLSALRDGHDKTKCLEVSISPQALL